MTTTNSVLAHAEEGPADAGRDPEELGRLEGVGRGGHGVLVEPDGREPRGGSADGVLQVVQVLLHQARELDAGEHEHRDEDQQDEVDDGDDDGRRGGAVPAAVLQRVPDRVHDDDEHRGEEQRGEHLSRGVDPGEDDHRRREEQERPGGGREALGRCHGGARAPSPVPTNGWTQDSAAVQRAARHSPGVIP